MRLWPLEDLATVGDLGKEFGVSNGVICNWNNRYPDFPKPLTILAAGAVYSRREVIAWHRKRKRYERQTK